MAGARPEPGPRAFHVTVSFRNSGEFVRFHRPLTGHLGLGLAAVRP
jgi:hypothetical protein